MSATALREIAADLARFHGDPLGFVLWAFPWGRGELALHPGPDVWQVDVLARVRAELARGAGGILRFAVAAGHGVGKSALVAWLLLWLMATRPHLAGVVTANTLTQLSTKTWRELSLWHKRLALPPLRQWFEWTATRFMQAQHRDTWMVAGVPWSERHPEAFAGLHAADVVMIFDESSAIPDVIWETAEGAMTTPGALWFVFGNPTRNTGRFAECFARFRHRWVTWQVDARGARMADQSQLAAWVDDYGEDSDFVRIRVRGVFPRASSRQLIPLDLVDAARRRPLELDPRAPLLLGVDIARFGDDSTVLYFRRGRDARSIPARRFRGLDNVQVAAEVKRAVAEHRPDAVMVDGGGLGAGVVDILRSGGQAVVDVGFGEAAQESDRFVNTRTEMWHAILAWLREGGCLPDDQELSDDLTGPEYTFDPRDRWALEPKPAMKRRGLASPDAGDALAMTFAPRVEWHPADVVIGARLESAGATW